MPSSLSIPLPENFRALGLSLAADPYGNTLLLTQLNTLHLYRRTPLGLRLEQTLPQSDIIQQAVFSPVAFGRLLALALNNGVLVILQQKEEDYCVTYRCSQHNTAYLDCLFLESAPVPLLVAVSLDGLVSVTKCVQGQFQQSQSIQLNTIDLIQVVQTAGLLVLRNATKDLFAFRYDGGTESLLQVDYDWNGMDGQALYLAGNKEHLFVVTQDGLFKTQVTPSALGTPVWVSSVSGQVTRLQAEDSRVLLVTREKKVLLSQGDQGYECTVL